jgi:myxalamid-type polyketide synthase MxaF
VPGDAASGGQGRLAAQGVQPVGPADWDLALDRVLEGAPGWLAVLRLNARHWMQTHPGAAASPLLSDLLAEPRTTATSGASFREELAGLAMAERRIRLEDYLRGQLALTVQQDPELLHRSTTFRSLGLESLMAVELRNRLEAGLGTRLSVALLFTVSTIAALVDHVLDKLGLADPEPAAGASHRPDLPQDLPREDLTLDGMALDGLALDGLALDDIEAMSDEEAERLLLHSIRLVDEETPDG